MLVALDLVLDLIGALVVDRGVKMADQFELVRELSSATLTPELRLRVALVLPVPRQVVLRRVRLPAHVARVPQVAQQA